MDPIDHQHPLLTLHPVLIHIVSIPAVVFGSYQALNVWRAVRALRQHPSSIVDKPTPVPSTIPKTSLGLRARLASPQTKAAAIGITVGLVFLAFEGFLVFVLPRISSQFVFDLVVSVFLVVALTPTFGYAIGSISPLSQTAQWHRTSPTAPLTLVFAPAGDRTVAGRSILAILGAGSILAVASVILTSFNITVHHPLIAGTIVFSALATMRFPRMSIRKIVLFISGYLTLVPFVSISIGLIVNQFSGNDPALPDDHSEEKKLTIASDWILSLMFIYADIFAVMVPVVLTAMTLRFEHAISSDEPARPVGAAADAPVLVPTGYVSFRKPIFISSLVSLSVGLAAVEAIGFLVPDLGFITVTPLACYITVPIVFIGTALSAKWDGKLIEWWNYNEVWVPKLNNASDAEEGAAKSIDEQPLLGTENKEAE